MRLFTAIEIPEFVALQLSTLQPRLMPGMRLVKAEQMHLTLHFIGEADVEPYRAAMETVRMPAFTMTMDTLGKFSNPRGSILWAGIREEPGLMQLHKVLETALESAGYRPEKRAYHPHLTLARCDNRVPGKVIAAFVKQPMVPLEVKVEEVVLFSSVLSDKGPQYEREGVYPLQD